MQRAGCVPERTKYDPGLFRGTRFFRLRLLYWVTPWYRCEPLWSCWFVLVKM